MSSAEEQQQLLEEEIRRKKAMFPELKAKAMELEHAVKGEWAILEDVVPSSNDLFTTHSYTMRARSLETH